MKRSGAIEHTRPRATKASAIALPHFSARYAGANGPHEHVGGFSRVTPIAFIVFGGQYAQALVTLFALQLAPLLGRHTLPA